MEEYKSGFIAGSCQSIIGHPFDTIKTCVQTGNKFKWKMAYKGFTAPFIGGCLQNALLFGLEDKFSSYGIWQSGFIAGAISTPLLSASEYIKCHQQVGKKWLLKDCFRGIGYTFLRDAPGFSIYFGSYHYLQRNNDNPLLNGGLAGMFSWIYSYPIDVAKTRYQLREPIRFDFKGVKFMVIRAFLVNAGIFYVFEKLKE